jgi:hypothetical protein
MIQRIAVKDLIGGAADATRTDFNRRRDVLQRLLEDGQRVALDLAFDAVESAVDDLLGDRLLALVHDRVHELRDHHVAVLGVGNDFAFLSSMAARHGQLLNE